MTIHLFDYCPATKAGDRHCRYRAEVSCEPCIERGVARGLLTERNARTMRYFLDLDARRECRLCGEPVHIDSDDGIATHRGGLGSHDAEPVAVMAGVLR